jgi:hypothetical protein
MASYAFCLHSFLSLLTLKLPGIRIGRRASLTSVVAYADDVTIFVTSVANFAIVEVAIHLYERASGTRLNPRKSKAIAVEIWRTQQPILGIAYHPSVTILNVTIWSTIEQTIHDHWAQLTGKVRTQARGAYPRGQFLASRLRYVNTSQL